MGKSAVYYAERAQARAAAYKYVNNPFAEGSRIARFYDKAKRHKEIMDAEFDDMEEVYGVFATKVPVIDNIPGTFRKKKSANNIAPDNTTHEAPHA